MFALMDMHQDVLSEKFCGEGVPLWAAIPNKTNFPVPLEKAYDVDPETQIPKNRKDCDKLIFGAYQFAEAPSSAYQNLYDNAYGLAFC